MATIVDALLDLMVAQGADALIVEADRPPVLSRAGAKQPLSMPGLDTEMFADVLRGLTDDAERAELERSGGLRTDYVTEAKRTFVVTIEKHGAGHRLTFRTQQAAVPTPQPPAPPAARARPQQQAAPPRAEAPLHRAAPPPTPAAPIAHVAPDDTPIDTLISAGPPDEMLDELLSRARMEDASDILVSTGVDARMRVGGDLVLASGCVVTREQLLAFLGAAWNTSTRTELEASGSADLAFVHMGLRYRVNVFRQIGGLSAAFRPVRTEAPTLVELGLPEDLYRLAEFRNGLVLVTGTAGSGKSTTLIALLERINRTQAKHIITLEDPIEYTYGPGASMIHQREVGVHVDSFSTGLRAALREAPDVILVGEMRDRDTIAAALTAAETGHLVLSSLHCADAGMAVDRIIDVFPEHQQAQVRDQLAGVLRAVITQVLLPSQQPPQRVPAFEKLLVNTAVATKIRERRGHQMRSEIQTGRAEGMVPLELTLARLVRDHRISKATAKATAHDPQLLEDFLRGRA